MAAIREYTNKIEGLNVSDRGVSATAQAARSTEMTGLDISRTIEGEARNIQEAGTAVAGVAGTLYDRHVVQPEISQGLATLTTMQDVLSREWQETATAADVNDASIRENFINGRLAKEIEKFSSGFNTNDGQKWAQQHAERLRGHFLEKTASDMSTRAGQALKVNFVKTQNALSNAVYNDPSSLDFSVDTLRSTIPVLVKNSPLLSVAAGAQVSEKLLNDGVKNLVQAGFRGMAERDPDAAQAWLAKTTKYDQYISGEEKSTLNTFAEAHRRAKVSDARAAEEYSFRLKKREADRASVKVISDNLETRDDGTVIVKPGAFSAALKIAEKDGADRADVLSLISAFHSIERDALTREKVVSDNDTVEDFRKRVFLSEDDPRRLTFQEIDQARANKRLSVDSWREFRAYASDEVRNAQTIQAEKKLTAYFESVKRAVTSATLLNPGGVWENQRWGEFMANKRMEFHQGLRAGKTATQLLGPGTPDFIGNDIYEYQITQNDAMKQLSEKVLSNLRLLPPVGARGTVQNRILGTPGDQMRTIDLSAPPVVTDVVWNGKESMQELSAKILKSRFKNREPAQ